MSKERARRREAREKEAAIIAAARAAQAEKRERRDARSRAVRSRLPSGGRKRQTGILAQRRRRQTAATIALVLGLNLLVWVIFPDWPTRVMVLLVSLLAVPVLHTMLFRR